MDDENQAPQRKVFVSYSWTSEQHELWVIKLCTDLESSGVEVVLDKWNLREGFDKHAFMEQCVTDPSVHKVIVVSDRAFSEKADARQGGVGTETQILTPDLYSRATQNRVVAVVTEKDHETGEAFLPQYLKGRLYIDMSSPGSHDAGLEQLIRWIFDKPLHERPPRGKAPSYIVRKESGSLGTDSRYRRALSAIEEGRHTASGAYEDFLDALLNGIEGLGTLGDGPNGHSTAGTIEDGIAVYEPYREQVISLVKVGARYDLPNQATKLHRFFEGLLSLIYEQNGLQASATSRTDMLKFLAYETFLSVVAALVDQSRFIELHGLLEADLLLPQGAPDYLRISNFTVFRAPVESLVEWNKTQAKQWLSPAGALLKQRAAKSTVTFSRLMEADFVLFVRADAKQHARWWPHTLVYAGDWPKPFDRFLRSHSRAYFDQFKVALGIDSADDLRAQIARYGTRGDLEIPRWEFQTFSPAALADIANVATQP